MADISNFRRAKHAALASARRRSNERWAMFWLLLLAFVVAAGVASLMLGALPLRISGLPVSAASPAVAASFPICGSGRRITCVVDGDTFWLDGLKYRIADIDTPEISQAQCAAEKALGDRATGRLADLLNAGPFTLAPADRDEDRYGRKLRMVYRDGASLGDSLVAEGLAHRWDGSKHPWC
jgi:endonuclease YncB( thermonuclease family)